ncbi:MAG: aspartate aminotransferase family protein [Puniceicoccales bacterium]|jgi:acetylornithine/succinyldiaminopimelate/putrescine aminotransferase|nr:aspartate aminotransferase family protein [Puniceicoccales bacterium]
MGFDIKNLVAARFGTNYELHEQYLNRTLVKVLHTIGFAKCYKRAEGCYLYDGEGNEYLDFLSGYGVYGIGRNHPVLKQAIRDVLDMDLSNMVQMDCALLSGLLGEAVAKAAGADRDSCFFGNSGTEVNEAAIKFARAATGRNGMLSLKGSYHGLSYGSLTLTQNNNFQDGFGELLPGVEYVAMGDLVALEEKLRTRRIAGFIVEPVQGKGVHFPGVGGVAEDYYVKAQALCRQYGTLFICDEVQCGLGRAGKMFAFEHWGLDPDIVTMAKTLSGGYVPVGAIVTRRPIYQGVFSNMKRCVVHSSTFGRNNLAMACGLATLHVLQEEKLVERSAERGRQLMDAIRGLAKKHDMIKEVRGLGCMIAIEFQRPSNLLLRAAWKIFDNVDKGLFPEMIVHGLMDKHRVLTQVAGHNMDVIKILPPYTIGDREIERFVSALDSVLEECRSPLGPMWAFGANLAKHALAAKKTA